LNVLINGGAQRGHTVDFPDGRRHVFHHFGSASLAGADSYADEDFIVNPLVYVQERSELESGFGVHPRLILSDRCRVSTPLDMMLGQIIELSRGTARHGSCGLGIFETRLRYETSPTALKLGDLAKLSQGAYIDYLSDISKNYIPARLKKLGMRADEGWQELLSSRELFLNSYLDFRDMLDGTFLSRDWASLGSGYRNLIFEAGQGLMLDEKNRADFPYLTPSRTTTLISARRIAALSGETNARVVYVTRSYFTRHGAGPFPTECSKSAINAGMEDLTNVPNPHQQALRYGLFDTAGFLRRTGEDLAKSREVLPQLGNAVLVTHLNETGGKLAGGGEFRELASRFDKAFVSFDPYGISPAEGTKSGRSEA
ncbi:MAG: adenylosuccinate synthetase, partial [Firmicutes bacterium]|nr:adenylosuccinate synthetase [Bacillota bacterium]